MKGIGLTGVLGVLQPGKLGHGEEEGKQGEVWHAASGYVDLGEGLRLPHPVQIRGQLRQQRTVLRGVRLVGGVTVVCLYLCDHSTATRTLRDWSKYLKKN